MVAFNELSVGALVPGLIGLAFILPAISLGVKNKKFFHIYGSLVTLGVAVVSTYNLFEVIKSGPIIYAFGGWPPPLGIVYEVDSLSALLSTLTAWLIVAIVMYSWWYLRLSNGLPYYYTLLLGLEAGLIGCYYTGDAFNFFVMLEVLSISAYALVAYYRGKGQAIEAAVKYGLIGAVATTIYFIALIFLYGSFGTLNIADLALKSRFLASTPFSGSVYGAIPVSASIGLALALWTFTYKSAVFPNHFWLPDAHPEAPTPVSAALSGLVINVGAYATLRFMYTVFGNDSFLAVTPGIRNSFLVALLVLGISSGLVGALMMLVQEDVKRLLAYSTVSHVGLIFIGVAIGLSYVPAAAVTAGLTGALYHIINHAVGKALLFLGVGVFIVAAGGSRKLDDLAGIGRKYPAVTAAVFIGFLQLMGVPPFGGFFSKFLLYQAYMSAGMPLVAGLIVAISAISVLGYSKVIYSIWFRPLSRDIKASKASVATWVALVLAGACITLGLVSYLLTPALQGVISSSLTPAGVSNYITTFINSAKSLGPWG